MKWKHETSGERVGKSEKRWAGWAEEGDEALEARRKEEERGKEVARMEKGQGEKRYG